MSLAISIVSHGHALQVRSLLTRLALPGAMPLRRIWLTLNVPEPELASLAEQIWPFDLEVTANVAPLGFGANHNQAFACEMSKANPASRFCVLNPDLSWQADPLPALLSALDEPLAGCAFPLQFDTLGQVQDHRRMLPSPLALLQRYMWRKARAPLAPLARLDWVNAACLVFPSSVYKALGGFDARYFMYCEDVDLSLRLQLAGYALVEAPTAHVVHDASRASRTDMRHLVWHVRSLLRLWSSPVYRRFRSASSTSALCV